MSQAVNRAAVKVGIDFRPIPLDMGDGREWEFDADPDPGLFNDLQSILNGLKGVEKDPENVPDLRKANADLIEGLIPLIVNEDQRDEFRGAGYGIFALQRLVVVYVEQISGFPTTPPSGSGRRR